MNPRNYAVVGHRGYPERYPENSLLGLLAAAECGANAVEFDVQMSADGVPMVHHDLSLQRACDQSGRVSDFSEAQLNAISCHEPARFGERYRPTPLVSVREVCQALSHFDCEVFIELKEESLHAVGREAMLQAVLDASAVLGGKRHIISFDWPVLELAQQLGDCSIGWVLRKMDAAAHQQAQQLQPQTLIYDVKKLSDNSALWQGAWRWFLYDIVDPKLAETWSARGVHYIETWDCQRLLCP